VAFKKLKAKFKKKEVIATFDLGLDIRIKADALDRAIRVLLA
jgi:hypothetical protein